MGQLEDKPMIDSIQHAWRTYPTFYAETAENAWRSITPVQYGLMLTAIAFFGWWLMKRGATI
ncbi:MAG: hypothetical protein CMJ78_02855 [Planctomycetaceae bacterium]|nr:hypothetical protein [Planctomycetaceae bacterium]